MQHDFVEREQMLPRWNTPQLTKSQPRCITLTGIVERTPAEAQCTPTDVPDQRPAKLMPTDVVEQKPAEVILTPTGVVSKPQSRRSVLQRPPSTNGLAKVMPTDLVEQKPAAVEYAPTDKKPSEAILTASGVVDQTVAEAQRTPTEVVNQRSSRGHPN